MFYFLLCISLTCQTLFFLKTVQKYRTCFCVLPASQANIWTGAQNDRILKKADIYKVPWQISHAWIDTYAGVFLLEKHNATTFFVLPLQSWMIVSSRSTILVVVRIRFNHLFESCKISVTETNKKTTEFEIIDFFFFRLVFRSLREQSKSSRK